MPQESQEITKLCDCMEEKLSEAKAHENISAIIKLDVAGNL